MWWIYVVYVLLLVVVVYLSIKLANLVDLLDKKTSISGAFIGGVLLAAVTSLPELFTSISSVVIVNDPELVVGNILGSDIFNLMILGVYTLIFFKNFRKADIAKWHFVSLVFLVIMYGLAAYAIFVPSQYQLMLGDINVVSLIILALYVFLIIKQPKETNSSEEETNSKLTIKQIVILFILCAVILIGASIGITYMTDMISNEFPWLSGSIAGAVLLGVATSLPEVISTFHLFRIKNYDAGYGNMIGSCTFNFLVLGIADLISWEAWNGSIIVPKGIFIESADSRQLAMFGLIAIAFLGVFLALKLFTKFFEKKKYSPILGSLLCVVPLVCYLLVFIL